MKYSATANLLFISIVSDTCLGCAGQVLPSNPEDIAFTSESREILQDLSVPELMDCRQSCEDVSWEDLEANDFVSDLMAFSEFINYCQQTCEQLYSYPDQDLLEENYGCSCNSCNEGCHELMNQCNSGLEMCCTW